MWYFRYNFANNYIELWVDGVEVARFKANGDIDLHGTLGQNAF